MKAFIGAAALALATFPSGDAFIAPAPLPVARTRAAVRGPVMENFNLPVGEDQAENVPVAILGEANYRKFVSSYNPDGLIVGGPTYPLFKRVSELKLLSLTAKSGLLTRLEELGLKLSDLEKLLPLAEELELLSLAEKNKDFILKTLAPLAVEQAPLLLPLAVTTLKTPPGVFYGVAAAALAAEAGVALAFNNVGLDVILGIPLLGLAGASAIGGSILSSGIKIPTPSPSAAKPAAAKAGASAGGRPKIAAVAAKAPAAKAGRPTAAVKAAAPAVKAPLTAAPAASKPRVGPLTAAPRAAPAAKAAPSAAPKAAAPAKAAKPAAVKVAAKPAAKAAAPAPKAAAPAPKAAVKIPVSQPAAKGKVGMIPKAVPKK